MQNVHKPEMVAHLWANKSQDQARNSGATLYFTGDTIYSYGSHFPIARHVKSKRGSDVVLLTLATHSTTTARHVSIVGRACDHFTTFRVHDIEAKPGKQFRGYREDLARIMEAYARAKGRRPVILEEMERHVKSANDFAKSFGLKSRLEMPSNLDAMVEECKLVKAATDAKQKRMAAKRLKAVDERMADWIAGKFGYPPIVPYGQPVRLRIVGDTLETSAGAEVPLDHAVRAFKLLKRWRDGGTVSSGGKTLAIHVGHFHIESMDENGIKAGCHTIEWAEIERIAALAGVA
jgi:hypothetical protein